jgi:spore coat protein CotH
MPNTCIAARRRALFRMSVVAVTCVSLGTAVGCTTQPGWWSPTSTTRRPVTSGTRIPTTASPTTGTTATTIGTGPTTPTTVPQVGLLDSSRVHNLSVRYDQAEYDEMIAEFVEKGDKDWIHASITIDGTTLENVGIRLKGNSSLFPLRRPGGGGGTSGGATAQTPEKLPWLVRFDKYVDGQQIGGRTEIVVRSNPTQTALNEAVSLELLGQTGLATQFSAPYRFTVNGTRTALRLVTEVPGDEWDAANFESPGILYKAEAGGDYSYRGEDPEAYDEIFEQESGEGDNLQPLIDFLKFINQSSDADFASQLPAKFDIGAFADYMAFEDLIGNWDDIEGPGNNSYLRWSTADNTFTIVAWDHNLALGARPRFGGGAPPPPPAPPTTTPTTRAGAPATTAPRPPVGVPGRGNILVRRFKAVPAFNARYNAAMVALRAKLYGSNNAGAILARRANVLRTGAAGLVTAATIDAETRTISSYFRP